jgi:hypothetical protein
MTFDVPIYKKRHCQSDNLRRIDRLPERPGDWSKKTERLVVNLVEALGRNSNQQGKLLNTEIVYLSPKCGKPGHF